MADLEVPFGKNEFGKLVAVEDAINDQAYFCPECGIRLILRAGAIKIRHFSHPPNSLCHAETITHKTAKLRIDEAIKDWKAGMATAPLIERRCLVCRKKIRSPLPAKVETSQIEYRLPDGYIVDVALMSGDTPMLGVEIYVAHRVDQKKAETISIPFIELNGNAVIKDPLVWQPIAHKLNPYICRQCKEIVKTTGLAFPTNDSGDIYYSIRRPCYKCHKDIVIYTWPGKSVFNEKCPSYRPVPDTIQCRRVDYAKFSWLNTCPHCLNVQNDFDLFEAVDGPFYQIQQLLNHATEL